MKAILRHINLLIGGLFICCLFSCKNSNELVATPGFEPEIEQQQNLEFTFNRDVVPDSLVARWDSAAYIDIDPAVKGSFKWKSTNTLIFSPAAGFAPGANYTAKLTKQLLKYSKKDYGISSAQMHFHTAPMQITAANFSWTRSNSAQAVQVQLELIFNYETDLAAAAKLVRLQSDGREVKASSFSTGTGKALTLQFAPLNDKDEETPVTVNVGSGISVTGSDYVSARDTAFSGMIPSRYHLSITNVSAFHTGDNGVITVSTSQPVLENNLKEALGLDPKADFMVVVNNAGFTITSNQVSASKMYQLSISTALEGAFGGRLKSGFSENISFGKLKPSINFVNTKGMYLSNAGYKNILLNIINVPAVEVTVVKVFENNLESFMRRGKDYDYHYDDKEDESTSYEFYETEDLGDVIFTRVYESSKLPGQNAARVLHLDLEDRLKNYDGVYVIRVRSAEHQWIQESKILCVSDIGLIVKAERDNVYVFANSIKNATAMAGVKVNFVSTTNQKMYTATTDAEGVAAFKDIATTAPGFRVGMVTAKKDDQFSFIWFDKTRIGTSRFDVGGRRPNESGLIAMIYAERNLYRPGETLHLSTVVRNEQWQAQADVPVKIKLMMPNGREFASVRKVLNAQGACEVAFTPPPTAITGVYEAVVYTGNDVLLNSYNISVEEFMPDRMKVALKTEKDDYKPGDQVTASIQADNLFGTPAAGRNYQCELNLSKGTFGSDKYPDYHFDIEGDVNINTDNREGKTNEQGAGTEVFKLDAPMADAGLLLGNVMATVFDETGRPVHRYAHFKVFTQPVFAGIKCREEYIATRKPVKLGLLALDKSGMPQSVTANVVVVKREWHTVIRRYGNSYRYVSQSEDRELSQDEVQITGTGSGYTFIAQHSGEYRIRVYIKGGKNYTEKRLYAYGWGDASYTSFEVSNEGNVEIKADKKSYNTGEQVHVLFTTPFEGRMLVTLEREHLVKHYYLQTKDKSASLTFDAADMLLPNVYVTATLFRPMDGSDMPLTVAHGFESVTITNPKNELPVKITAVEQSRSRQRQQITVKTAPGAFVTVAAVDEGILQIKSFETPDPYRFFYQKAALAVMSYDVYPWLMPEVKSTLSSTGGDGSGGDGSRVNPLFVNRVKNVSFWSGIRQADGSGVVKYDIDIPQFSGDIRIMAYAYRDNGFGSSDLHMKVADPVVISTALPRFLSPKDEVVMPVSLSNTTGGDINATVTVVTSGPLGVVGSSTQTITLPAKREQRVVFNVSAQSATGKGKVTVTVNAGRETFVNETELAVRPPASLQKLTANGFAAENKTTSPELKNNFIPASFAGKLIVGKSPLTRFSKHIDDLVRYPYGCVEQTTSAAFPQLYYADLVKSLDNETNVDKEPAYNVQQAINKLQSMQFSNGGLSYWPQGGEISWWGSIYACHFLTEAGKLGYDVNTHTLDRLYEYIRYRLFKKEVVSFFYNGGKKKNIAPEEIPYSLYVLSLAGQADQSGMNYYKAHTELLSLDGKYMLAAAYALSGQPSMARDVLPPAFTGEVPDNCLGGSFNSYTRDLALSLNVLMDIDPLNSQVGIMSRQLSDQVAKQRYLSTQEKAFSVLAMGKIAKLSNKTTATAVIKAGGKEIARTSGQTLTIDLKPYANDDLTITTSGKGGYYYFQEMSGITADGSYKEEDSYLKVRRTFFDRNGNEKALSFRQNDLVVVRISVEAMTDADVENVAITDMLPAGFEIENSRLNAMPKLAWIKTQFEPQYRDVRDDRINMFVSASRKRKDYYYMARAVSPGTYQLGPVQADAMYDGNYHSYHGAGVVKISE